LAVYFFPGEKSAAKHVMLHFHQTSFIFTGISWQEQNIYHLQCSTEWEK